MNLTWFDSYRISTSFAIATIAVTLVAASNAAAQSNAMPSPAVKTGGPGNPGNLEAAGAIPYVLSEPIRVTEPIGVGESPVVVSGEPNGIAETRRRILFQPAVPYSDPRAGTILRPTVHLDGEPAVDIPMTTAPLVESLPLPTESELERIPVLDDFQPNSVWVPSDDKNRPFGERKYKPLQSLYQRIRCELRDQKMRDIGVGVERLPFALFEIDASQPTNSFRIRFESAFDWEYTDRAEFLWSQINAKGPSLSTGLFENSLDYQEMRIITEVGGKKFSVTTEIPLRFINPTLVNNTGGMGDMVITTKTVMLDGDSLQLTQVMRNQMPTGAPMKGLGNGHVSMEQGLVARLKWSERTLIHNELKLWFPLGGDPEFSGNVLRYGFGVANVLYDSDTFAILPTMEFVGWSVLSGQQSSGLLGPDTLDGLNLFNIYPGVRIVSDKDGDLGMFELGIGGGMAVTKNHWYSSIIRLDMRWSF